MTHEEFIMQLKVIMDSFKTFLHKQVARLIGFAFIYVGCG